MFEPEPHESSPRYRTCRAGFTLVAIGLGLLCFSMAVDVACLFAPGFDKHLAKALIGLVQGPLWKWGVSGPITWTTLLGSYLLWAGWAESRWRRCAGLLLLLNLCDMAHWTIAHHHDLGLPMRGDPGHAWLRDQVTMGFGWAEFGLFAALAADLARYAGADGARLDARTRRAYGLVAIGGVFWAIQFLAMTDWHPPLWPLRHHQPRNITELLLLVLALPILTIPTTLNVVGLSALASRCCSRMLDAGPPEDDRGIDLLRSRSETDDFWKAPRH